jgi:hypothetical protein
MSTIREKQACASEAQESYRKEQDRINQMMAAVFGSDDGQQVLAHLIKRYDLTGRSFLAGEKGDVNALRAAVRDGERAVVNYVITRARCANKDFSIPL